MIMLSKEKRSLVSFVSLLLKEFIEYMIDWAKDIIEIIKMLKEFKNLDFNKLINFVLLYVNITVSIWFQNSQKIVFLVEKDEGSFPKVYFLVNILIVCVMDSLPIFDNNILKTENDILYYFGTFLAKVGSLFLWFGIMNFIGGKIFLNIDEGKIKNSILYASAWFPLIGIIDAILYSSIQSLSYAEIIYNIYNPVIVFMMNHIDFQTTPFFSVIIIMILSCTFVKFILCVMLWARTIFKGINIATVKQKIKFGTFIFFIVLGVNLTEVMFLACMYIYPVYNMQEAMNEFEEERYMLKDFTEAIKLKNENKEYKNDTLLFIDKLGEAERSKYILAYEVNKLKKIEEISDKIVLDNRLSVDYKYPYELYGIIAILQKQNDLLVFVKGKNYQSKEVTVMNNFLLNNRPDMLEFAIFDYINKQHIIELTMSPDDSIKYKFFVEKLKSDKKVMEDKKIEMKIGPELSDKKESVLHNLNFQKRFIEDVSKNESRSWKIFKKLINIIP